jgi:hypothetical protein
MDGRGCAGSGQLKGYGAAQTPSAPGDESGFALQGKCFSHFVPVKLLRRKSLEQPAV